MGKAVRTVAMIAVAAAIAAYAPQISAGMFVALNTQATTLAFALTTALVGAGLAAAAGVAMKQLGIIPNVGRSTGRDAPNRRIATAGIDKPFGMSERQRLASFADTMPAIHPGFWRAPAFIGLPRFSIQRSDGDCMKGVVEKDWAIIDRKATLRRGDFVHFRVRDQREAFGAHGNRVGMAKRFIGISEAEGVIEFECTNPQTTIQTGIDNVMWAYRAVALASTFNEASRLLWRVRFDPSLFDARLAV